DPAGGLYRRRTRWARQSRDDEPPHQAEARQEEEALTQRSPGVTEPHAVIAGASVAGWIERYWQIGPIRDRVSTREGPRRTRGGTTSRRCRAASRGFRASGGA